jgi:serine protease
MVKVFDVLGKEVATLVKGPGSSTVRWDAGSQSSGVYFYRLQTGTFAATRRLLLLR